jgi:hypothetical protein
MPVRSDAKVRASSCWRLSSSSQEQRMRSVRGEMCVLRWNRARANTLHACQAGQR